MLPLKGHVTRGRAEGLACSSGVQQQVAVGAAALRQRCPARPHRRVALRPLAAAAAAASPDPAQPQQQQQKAGWRRFVPGWLPGAESRDLLVSCWRVLAANMAAVIVIFAAKEGIVFVLHRITQRLTNAVAESALGVQLPPFVNPWYLFLESSFIEAHWGYQFVVAAFFLLSLPINIFFNAAASATAALVCVGRHREPAATAGDTAATGATTTTSSSSGGGNGKLGTVAPGETPSAASSLDPGTAAAAAAAAAALRESGSGSGSNSATSSMDQPAGSATFSEGGPSPGRQGRATFRPVNAPAPKPPRLGPIAALRVGAGEARLGIGAARPLLGRVWRADLLFNAWSLPLQAASLLVFPVFWTFPRLLAIQLAVPAAILSGTGPKASLEASQALMAGRAAAYAWPYVFLTLASRGVDALKQVILLTVPERWWREVIEVPIAVMLAFTVLKIIVMRMQDLLPLATYLRIAEGGEAAAAAAQAGGDGGSSGAAAAKSTPAAA